MKQLRNFLILASLITVVTVFLLITGSIALGIYGPLHPGNFLFQLQNFAEQEIKYLSVADQRPVYLMDLLDRRVNDLIISVGSKNELVALDYLGSSLDEVTQAISNAPQDKNQAFMARFYAIVLHINEIVKQLKIVPIENQDVYQSFQSKILAYIQTAQVNGVTPGAVNPTSLINVNTNSPQVEATPVVYEAPGLIPFPPGSAGAEHAFYPLVGQHKSLQCQSCHTGDRYIGTPKACIFCHIAKRPNPHYSGSCELCHTPVSWTDIHFDHNLAKAVDCVSCHFMNKPSGHYKGQCSACHVTQAWNIIHFNHAVAGAVDCISCHTKDTPANHYPGQCSRCHNTSNWTLVTFDHTGFNDCIGCHANKKPANHYAGQCSNCHNTSNWANAVFNHTGFTDCISCHSDNAPPNHFAGQCSRCHSTSTWKGAVFNHAGLTDCISCHAVDAPAGHFAGQCSNCHSTGGSWKNATFNHSGFTDCISCHAKDAPAGHYAGQCSNCHSTGGSWANAHFDHTGLTDCVSCHAGNAPANHYPGQCSNCHSTGGSWANVHFDHTGFTDCISCHLQNRPADHDQGQCSECHNTNSWGDGGGGGGGEPDNLGIINQALFENYTCSICHPLNIVMNNN